MAGKEARTGKRIEILFEVCRAAAMRPDESSFGKPKKEIGGG
jgi:hypothetical protein